MASFETTAGPGAASAWQPLGSIDYCAIGLATVVDVAVALLLAHVLWNGEWPPYSAAIPQVVVYASLAVVLATFGVSIRYGMWGEEGEDVGCDAVVCLTWLGLGALFSSAFLRVYRYHNVLVKQSGDMWPVTFQLVASLVPFTLAPSFLADPEMKSFDSISMECEPSSQIPELCAFAVMGIMAASALWLTFRLRVARVQAPYEFQTAVIISTTLSISAIVLPLVHVTMEGDANDRMGRRAAMLAVTAVTGAGVVVTPVLPQLNGYIFDEAKLKSSGDFCVGDWRPKRKTEHMIKQFKRFQDVASSPEGREVPHFPVMAKFFRALMAREESKDYPRLQVATMQILDTYFRPDAPDAIAVPMSEGCRTTTLQFKASSVYIFDRARAEMLEKMGIEKVHPRSRDPPPEEDPLLNRGFSSSTTVGVGSSYANSPGQQIETAANKLSPTTITAADVDDLSQPLTVAAPPPIKASPSFSRSPSTAESLQYSEDSTSSSQPPVSLSPLHPVSLSPRDSNDTADSDSIRHRLNAEACTTDNSPSTPLASPLDYRGADHDGNKKRETDGDGGDAGSGIVSVEHRNRGKNAILSLFGRLGGGEKRRGSQRVQDGGSSTESSPPVVHMLDEGFDSEGTVSNEAAAAEQGMAGRGRTGGRSSGVRKVAGVADVHAAFGLQKSKDEEDDGTLYYRSTGFLGGNKKKKKNDKDAAVLSSGIGDYGGILGGARSGADDPGDLAEAARAIPRPLFGDPSRAVGRQNNRRGNRAYRTAPVTSAVTVSTVAGAGVDDRAFASVTNNAPVIVPGNSLNLANSYALDVGALDEQESPLPATSTTIVGGEADTAQVNPLFDAGPGGGGKVRGLAKAFDVEAQALAVSGGLAVDNNKIGPAGKKKLAGKEKGRGDVGGGGAGEGGGDGPASSRLTGGSGSPAVEGIFTIAEGDKEEKNEDSDNSGDDSEEV